MNANEFRLIGLCAQGRNILQSARARAEKAQGRTFRPRAARVLPTTQQNGRTVVRLYGTIGMDWWDDEYTTAADLAATLDGISGDLHVRVNSGGGDVFDGIAMWSMLREHSGNVLVSVDGLAASAASFIAMAGDTVQASSPAKIMIHNARASGFYLDKVEAQRLTDVLTEIDATIADIYAGKSGQDASIFAALMDEETWMSASEAKARGLVDEIVNLTGTGQDDTSADETPAEGDQADEEAPEEAPAEEAPAPEDRRTANIRARARLALALKG